MDTGTEGIFARLLDFFWANPLMGSAAAACVIALALTPIAFVLLSRKEYLYTRRGRTYRKPEWWSVVCSMMLVMAVPGIILVLLVKSQYFDQDRYEFDPSRTWTIIDQGRGYRNLDELNAAVREEMERLANERNELVNRVKSLDEAMVGMRAAAVQYQPTAQALPGVLERLADVRRVVGVDAPQQLMDETAPPIELARMPQPQPGFAYAPPPGGDVAGAAPTAPAPALAGPGLAPDQREIELATVPDPQRKLASFLPLTELPDGWEIGKSGDRYLETFDAGNLYEKIDGRAESFIQYDVVGMAYTYYHPSGDPSNEVQLYLFELASPLKALGKFGSEKPPASEIEVIEDFGVDGYTSGSSVFFYADRYYTQVVPTSGEPEFQEFAVELARRVAAEQMPESAQGAASDGSDGTPAVSPEQVFALLPKEPGRGSPNYVTQDVFGYSFLSDVFLADYDNGETNWQGFVRPYATAEEALDVFEQYKAEAEAFDAEIKEVATDAADAMFSAENFGLIDVVFVKGNVVGGVNGATEADTAEAFTRKFASSLAGFSPFLDDPPAELEDAVSEGD